MQALPEHTIVFTSLKDGSHQFHYRLGPDFFLACGDEDLLGGEAGVDVDLEKANHLLVARIHVQGLARMLCDHCNAPMDQPVEGEQRQIFKLTGAEETDEDELVSLDSGAHEINLTHYIYECLRLHLPIRHVHPPGQCDPEVTKVLDKAMVNHEPDPRWAKLNQLKNKGA